MRESLFKKTGQNGVHVSKNYNESVLTTKFTSIYDSNSDNTVIMLNVERATVYEAKEFIEYVSNIINDGKNRIIIDLENVYFLDSVFFGAMIKLLKIANKDGGYIRLIAEKKSKPELLSISNFDGIFELYPNLFAAISGKKAG